MVQVPIVLGGSFAFAFYYFGYDFLAGLGVFLLATLMFLLIGGYQSKVYVTYMRRKDRRMKSTTESISNIKMLKLYAWQDSFQDRIYRRRKRELAALKKINVAWAFLISGAYMFPNLLPCVTFSVHIATGHTLTYGVTVAALIIFSIMQDPLVQFPYFITMLIEVIQSLKRIEKFLDLDEVQKGIIARGKRQDSDMAISVKGNFSWGFSTKKKEEEEKTGDETEKKESGQKSKKEVEAGGNDEKEEE